MKKQLTNISAIGAEQASPVFDEAGTIVAGPARVDVVEASEEQLQPSSQLSWMMSSKAWSAFIGRFATSEKGLDR